jgi:hypothetical protein
VSPNAHHEADRRGRRSYVIHASVARRRRVKRRKVAFGLAAVAAALLIFVLFGTEGGDRRLPSGGVASGSREVGSGKLDSRDGYVSAGGSLSPFSDEPAVTKLDPFLREALRQAADDAGAGGITLRVNGGWRSARYQSELLRRAEQTYGSLEVARQFVKPPDESSHVIGEAVDVGPTDGASWLARHGYEYGLCQIYANEAWHFELATAPGGTCPPTVSNAAGG